MPKGPSKQPRTRPGSSGSNQSGWQHSRNTIDGRRPGFPRERTVNLSYVHTKVFLGGGAAALKYQYTLNGAFDPDLSGTGHQPFQFDQWATLYNHYVVEECTATLDIYSSSPTSFPVVGFYVSDDATITSQAETLIESGSAYALLHPYEPTHRLQSTVSMPRFFDRKNIAADSALRAYTGSNPSETCIGTVWVQDSAITTGTYVYYTMHLDMKVRFMEPKDVASSLTLMRPSATVPTQIESEQEYELVRVKRSTKAREPGVVDL